VVFVNGEYWGLHEIRERLDKQYPHARYGVDSAEVDLLESAASRVEGDALHYAAMTNYIAHHGLVNDAVYEEIRRRMDVDNFLNYQLCEIFYANTDWPLSNVRFWRKRTTGYVEGAPPGHDGRWRWMMLDTDFGFGYTGSCFQRKDMNFILCGHLGMAQTRKMVIL
jgi:hypothetical protein